MVVRFFFVCVLLFICLFISGLIVFLFLCSSAVVCVVCLYVCVCAGECLFARVYVCV